MQILSASDFPDRLIDRFGSQGFQVGPVGEGLHGIIVRLDADGRIGRHPADEGQVLIPVTGDATVSGDDTRVSCTVGPGQAVAWSPGESHETTTSGGLIAVILEGALAASLIGPSAGT